MIEPETCVIQGDISRRDCVLLCREAKGAVVVEFGAGGSTLLLARCAKSLVTYETHAGWRDGTARRVGQIPDKTCEPELRLVDGVPDTIRACDLLFVDGLSGLRREWLVRFLPRAKTVMLHDSRRPGAWDMVASAVQKHGAIIDKVEFHADDSNMVVFRMRAGPASYRSWWDVEKSGRVWPRVERIMCRRDCEQVP